MCVGTEKHARQGRRYVIKRTVTAGEIVSHSNPLPAVSLEEFQRGVSLKREPGGRLPSDDQAHVLIVELWNNRVDYLLP